MDYIDKLRDFYFFGCTGIIPATILGFLSAIFDLDIGLILFIPIMLVWYLLVAIVWFKDKEK